MVKSLLCCLILACTGGLLLAQSKTPAPEYIFKLGVAYEMKSGDGRTNQMNVWFSNSDYSGIGTGEMKGMTMVYDLGRKIAVTFMEAQKMYMVMDLDKMKQQAEAKQKTETPKSDPAKDVKITKTGKTETILGYKCDQYQVINKTTTMLIWVTAALGSGYSNFLQSLSSMKGGFNIPEAKGLGSGVVMKMDVSDTAEKSKLSLLATSVNKDGMVIKTAGYKGMNVPGQ
ncbi:DUF4412 domain-containing protein [Flavihumibacter petaseus]|uniref:DUF4412 domain-containing protein n=1 Tax=Flavihumibacter petaseus NBRC 106054 TaxID=1220578 RepID=A0A0E9MYQ7_9BACT|nr:DUF4412 domain-containing protein [Flavihumibacter petaseus]GAO42551.1 hypothetical protein FPE01S_01_15660 [Flavihumibacter petaseus NBRC 106054]